MYNVLLLYFVILRYYKFFIDESLCGSIDMLLLYVICWYIFVRNKWMENKKKDLICEVYDGLK